MASPSEYGPRMLRCPACNAGLPVDGKSPVVTCMYCNARVEIDRRGQPHRQAPPTVHAAPPPVHAATPQRSLAWMSWLTVPLVLMISGGMATYQWYRAQSLVTTPSPPAVVTPVATPAATPIATPQHVTAIRDITTPSPTPEAEAARPADPPSAPTPTPTPTPTPKPKPKPAAKKPPASTGPAITVEEARKLLEPKARACLKQAKGQHMRAYMGNSRPGGVKVLPDTRTVVDGKKVALAKTPLGRCLNDAGAKVNTSAFKSNYVRLDVRVE